jgi:RNA polymerase sigma-70 factor, ECF subfamily
MYQVRMHEVPTELIDRARAGDAAALDALFGELVDPAFSLALILLRDREAAEDAVQEAAVRAWRKLGRLPAGGQIRPWFLAFVANQCRNARRARWRSVLKLDQVGGGVASEEERIVRGADLRRAVAALRYDQRVAIVLHYFLDLPLEEVALVTGVPTGTVKSRLHRATERLRARLAVMEVV